MTTSIQGDGRRINTYNIGRNQSEKARKEIEEQFGLIQASGKNKAQIKCDRSAPTQKVKYGFAATKQSITGVLEAVLDPYHYTSLPELNAILKQYNVLADRGKEGSRIYRNKGLMYRILDESGKAVGVPIKASSIYFKPTLTYLEQRFQKGEAQRAPHQQKLKTAIGWTLHHQPESILQFVERLKAEKVHVELRRNDEGYVYGITFIDFRTKCVFNGSDLGKGYSAAAIQQRILRPANMQENTLDHLAERAHRLHKDHKTYNPRIRHKKKSVTSERTNRIQMRLRRERCLRPL